jgi:hypothetical protein
VTSFNVASGLGLGRCRGGRGGEPISHTVEPGRARPVRLRVSNRQPGRSASTAVALVGAVGVLGASFLPWVRSGGAHRTSYELVRAAERLDVVSGRAALVARAWYLLPLVVAAACLAASLGRLRVSLALSAVAGAAATLLAALVGRSPLTTEVGWTTTLPAAALVLVGVSCSLINRTPWVRRTGNLRSVVTRGGGFRHLNSRE